MGGSVGRSVGLPVSVLFSQARRHPPYNPSFVYLSRDQCTFDISSSYLQGAVSASDYPVSFHYVKSREMYEIEYFMYRAHAYGIVGGLESVNPTSNELTLNDMITIKSLSRKRKR